MIAYPVGLSSVELSFENALSLGYTCPAGGCVVEGSCGAAVENVVDLGCAVDNAFRAVVESCFVVAGMAQPYLAAVEGFVIGGALDGDDIQGSLGLCFATAVAGYGATVRGFCASAFELAASAFGG